MLTTEDERGGHRHLQVYISKGEIPPTEFPATRRRAFRHSRCGQTVDLPHN